MLFNVNLKNLLTRRVVTSFQHISPCTFRLPPNINSSHIFSRNHVAYTVVHVGSIRRTLDRGTVLPPRKSNQLISGYGDKKIVVSPSIVRATALTNEKKFL